MEKEQILLERKLRLERRLRDHDITLDIKHLTYLDYNPEAFVSPYEAGCRMMVLYAVSYTAQCPEDKNLVSTWLKEENLWKYISLKEKKVFESEVDEDLLIELSWQGERAYIIAWALNLVQESPSPEQMVSQEQLEDFASQVPELGSGLEHFLSALKYRNPEEIIEEDLFYELATSYSANLESEGKDYTAMVDRYLAFERHHTLNWLRGIYGDDEWDS